MTHKEWENGKELTVDNATKEQLIWMVKDRDEQIKHLYEELQKERVLSKELASVLGMVLGNISNSRNKSDIDWENHELLTDKEVYLQMSKRSD